jgi:F0F1-type ATP synthase assembly protein I
MKPKPNIEVMFARFDERQEQRHTTLLKELAAINKWQEEHQKSDNTNYATMTESIGHLNNLSTKVGFISSVLTGAGMWIFNRFTGNS